MKQIYSDELIEIKLKRELEIDEMLPVAMACIDSWLIGIKSFCRLAKDPLELWDKCKGSIMKSMNEMEEILKG